MADPKKTTSDSGTAQADATAADLNQPAEEKVVYFNTTQGVHPRHHQPADPKEADRVNKDASGRGGPSDKVASTYPSEAPDPKEVKKSAKEANDEASELNAKGE